MHAQKVNNTALAESMCMQVGKDSDGRHEGKDLHQENEVYIDLGLLATPELSVEQCRFSRPVCSWDLVGLRVEVPVGLGRKILCGVSVLLQT